MYPGIIALTLMLLSTNSRANPFVNPIKAALFYEYATDPADATIGQVTLDKFKIFQYFCF